jgi:hypothetical protein
VSQLAAAATGAGSCVTPVMPSPTPPGPSSSFRAGTHNRVIAGISPAYAEPLAPCTMEILSAKVI